MNQQDKQLLLTDLCARLPYGVKFKLTDIGIFNMDAEYGVNPKAYKPMNMTNFYHCSTDPRFEVEEDSGYGVGEIEIDEFVPILFPLSALTKEITIAGETFVPIDKLGDGVVRHYELNGEILFKGGGSWEGGEEWIPLNDILLAVDLLNKWHIDYRGLIDKGLAVSVYSLDKNPYE